MIHHLPPVVLDTTLADLYRRGNPKNRGKRIAQVLSGSNAGLALTDHIPRNAKYLYQDASFNAVPEHEPAAGAAAARAGLQRDLALKFLSLVPQRDAFISGDTDVVLFHISDGPEQKAHDRAQADQTMAVLPEAQRPNLVFCLDPADIPVEEAGIDLIAHKTMLDGLEKYQLLVPPETHWHLNSKAALARSGLPTPECDVIELDGYAGDPSRCCALCRADPASSSFPVPAACDGPRGRWIADQTARICAALSARALPFVLKNQQTLGGAGTYLVRTEGERRRLIEDLGSGVLRKLLSAVTESNAHLAPGSLLLSELVADPVGNYGLTFFVPDDDGGEPIFLAASEQTIDDSGSWTGSTIDYSRQGELEARFGSLVARVARWLQGRGYVGPAGADVLEIGPEAGDDGRPRRSPDDDASLGRFRVVDLNARTAASLCLPLLRGHFTARGLAQAASLSIRTGMQRDSFIELFASDFAAGRMCILSWYEDQTSSVSLADVAVGGEDSSTLGDSVRQLREATDEVTF